MYLNIKEYEDKEKKLKEVLEFPPRQWFWKENLYNKENQNVERVKEDYVWDNQ